VSRIWQEFYCGECEGYIDVKLNMSLNFEVQIVCPNCKHEHARCIRKGVIYEQGRGQSPVKDKIMPVASAYHKEPKTKKMLNAKDWGDRRDGVPVQQNTAREMLVELWYERFGGR
jgi:hypothetical protein